MYPFIRTFDPDELDKQLMTNLPSVIDMACAFPNSLTSQ